MTTDLYQSVIEFVDQSFAKHMPHFERTVYWFERFLPDFGEAEKIAAYSHDIERAFRPADKKEPNDYLDIDFLRMHEEWGAEIMRNFLQERNAPPDLIERVVHLISRHEEGWDEAQNALMDADSVSFLETNVEGFVRKKALVQGYVKVRWKLDWMYNRIHSEGAKREAEKNYEYWTSELEKTK